MKKIAKRAAALLFVVALVMSMMVVPASAAISWPSTNNIKTYVISTGNDTTVYQTASSTAKYGTIYAEDLITINGYSGSRLKVTYPVSSGTKTGYVEKSKVTSAAINSATSTFTASATIQVYRRASGNSTIGSISKNDKVYVIASTGSRQQVIYPLSAGGYKMGWINASNNSALLSPIKGQLTKSSNCTTNGQYCDYKASSGTAVYAPADGTVAFRQSYAVNYGKLCSYGNSIFFTSNDGKTTVLCAHLSSFNGVNLTYTSSLSYPCSSDTYTTKTTVLATRTVRQGDLLGYSGQTGNASGPHLHMEVKQNGTAVSPISAFTAW